MQKQASEGGGRVTQEAGWRQHFQNMSDLDVFATLTEEAMAAAGSMTSKTHAGIWGTIEQLALQMKTGSFLP